MAINGVWASFLQQFISIFSNQTHLAALHGESTLALPGYNHYLFCMDGI
jgi:hypothetical protein